MNHWLRGPTCRIAKAWHSVGSIADAMARSNSKKTLRFQVIGLSLTWNLSSELLPVEPYGR